MFETFSSGIDLGNFKFNFDGQYVSFLGIWCSPYRKSFDKQAFSKIITLIFNW